MSTDNPQFTPPRPAMPVRQPQTAAELPSSDALQQQPPPPMFEDPPQPPARKPRPPRKKPAKRAARIIRVVGATKDRNTKPKGKTVAKKRSAKRKTTAAAPATPAVAKNPNRPLENKNKLHAVLALSSQLRKPELTKFVELMDALEKLNRGSRKRILSALLQVYG